MSRVLAVILGLELLFTAGVASAAYTTFVAEPDTELAAASGSQDGYLDWFHEPICRSLGLNEQGLIEQDAGDQ